MPSHIVDYELPVSNRTQMRIELISCFLNEFSGTGRGNNAWNAYVASLNIMNAKILFSKSNLLVSKLFEPGTDEPLFRLCMHNNRSPSI